jgi:ATP adenylyltransferase
MQIVRENWPANRVDLRLDGLGLSKFPPQPRYTRRMDRLWTPWRYSYITRSDPQARSGVPAALSAWPPTEAEDKHCVFCNMIAAVDYAIDHGTQREAAEKAAHIVHRGQHCFICLNAFPYSTGHLLLLPYHHLDTLAALPVDVAHELMTLAQRSELALREVYLPNGINMGLNLGEAAGAGIANHMHFHALPRWSGDTNFMTVTADTRVLPEALDVTWEKLRAVF